MLKQWVAFYWENRSFYSIQTRVFALFGILLVCLQLSLGRHTLTPFVNRKATGSLVLVFRAAIACAHSSQCKCADLFIYWLTMLEPLHSISKHTVKVHTADREDAYDFEPNSPYLTFHSTKLALWRVANFWIFCLFLLLFESTNGLSLWQRL